MGDSKSFFVRKRERRDADEAWGGIKQKRMGLERFQAFFDGKNSPLEGGRAKLRKVLKEQRKIQKLCLRIGRIWVTLNIGKGYLRRRERVLPRGIFSKRNRYIKSLILFLKRVSFLGAFFYGKGK